MRTTRRYLNTLPAFDLKAASLYRQGLSTYQVAKKLNATQGKVARSLDRSKTRRRNYSEAGILAAAA